VVKAVSPLVAMLIGLALWVVPAPAVAQNPLTLPPAPAATTPPITTATTATTADSSSAGQGLSKNQEALIFVVGLVLLSSIVFVIRRDARTHAPKATSTERGAGRGTVPPLAKRVERNRAKGKAARRQRKRGR
jgi:hypothetical protein